MSAKIAAYAPCSMPYRTLAKIGAAARPTLTTPNAGGCECDYCEGRSIADKVHAYQHYMACSAAHGRGDPQP